MGKRSHTPSAIRFEIETAEKLIQQSTLRIDSLNQKIDSIMNLWFGGFGHLQKNLKEGLITESEYVNQVYMERPDMAGVLALSFLQRKEEHEALRFNKNQRSYWRNLKVTSV